MSNYFVFLDYLELRRRIEKRFAKPTWVLLHSLLFVVADGLWLAFVARGIYYPRGYFISPAYGDMMAIWSVILLLHTLWALSRSGASQGRRNEVIEREMRERIQNQDSYLSENPKDLFRIHGLLEEDLQKRAGLFYDLRLFAMLNVLIWLGSAVQDGLTSSFAWQAVPMLAVAFLPILVFGSWRRSRHEARIRKLLSAAPPPQQNDLYDDQRIMHLTDDGELIDFEPESYYDKKKKRDEAG